MIHGLVIGCSYYERVIVAGAPWAKFGGNFDHGKAYVSEK